MSVSKVSSVSEIRLLDRDKKILREIDRWRVCQGRHIKQLAGFSGQRACDRRLRKLIQAGYIAREKILYGVAGIYRLTSKGAKIEGLGSGKRKIRIEQIRHDITVLDTAIYFRKKHEIQYSDIQTEIQLHRQDGFGIRKHRPDFIYEKNNKITCVEIELSLKAKNRFIDIMKDNFLAYDKQIWIVPDLNDKISKTLQQNKHKYSNIEIIELNQIYDNQTHTSQVQACQETPENQENTKEDIHVQLFRSALESEQTTTEI